MKYNNKFGIWTIAKERAKLSHGFRLGMRNWFSTGVAGIGHHFGRTHSGSNNLAALAERAKYSDEGSNFHS